MASSVAWLCLPVSLHPHSSSCALRWWWFQCTSLFSGLKRSQTAVEVFTVCTASFKMRLFERPWESREQLPLLKMQLYWRDKGKEAIISCHHRWSGMRFQTSSSASKHAFSLFSIWVSHHLIVLLFCLLTLQCTLLSWWNAVCQRHMDALLHDEPLLIGTTLRMTMYSWSLALSVTARHCDGWVLWKASITRTFGRRSDESVSHFAGERLPGDDDDESLSIHRAERLWRTQSKTAVLCVVCQVADYCACCSAYAVPHISLSLELTVLGSQKINKAMERRVFYWAYPQEKIKRATTWQQRCCLKRYSIRVCLQRCAVQAVRGYTSLQQTSAAETCECLPSCWRWALPDKPGYCCLTCTALTRVVVSVCHRLHGFHLNRHSDYILSNRGECRSGETRRVLELTDVPQKKKVTRLHVLVRGTDDVDRLLWQQTRVEWRCPLPSQSQEPLNSTEEEDDNKTYMQIGCIWEATAWMDEVYGQEEASMQRYALLTSYNWHYSAVLLIQKSR